MQSDSSGQSLVAAKVTNSEMTMAAPFVNFMAGLDLRTKWFVGMPYVKFNGCTNVKIVLFSPQN